MITVCFFVTSSATPKLKTLWLHNRNLCLNINHGAIRHAPLVEAFTQCNRLTSKEAGWESGVSAHRSVPARVSQTPAVFSLDCIRRVIEYRLLSCTFDCFLLEVF